MRCVTLVINRIQRALSDPASHTHQASKAELKKFKDEFEEFEKQMDSL